MTSLMVKSCSCTHCDGLDGFVLTRGQVVSLLLVVVGNWSGEVKAETARVDLGDGEGKFCGCCCC